MTKLMNRAPCVSTTDETWMEREVDRTRRVRKSEQGARYMEEVGGVQSRILYRRVFGEALDPPIRRCPVASCIRYDCPIL